MNKENNNLCALVTDSLPLYAENLLSKESELIVADHLKKCENCREYLAETKKNTFDTEEAISYQAMPLKVIKERLLKKRLATQLAVLLAILLFSVAAYAGTSFVAPVYKSVENVEDCKIKVEKSADGNVIGYCEDKNTFYVQRTSTINGKTVLELIPWTSGIARITNSTTNSLVLSSAEAPVDAVYIHERCTGDLFLLYGTPLDDVKHVSDLRPKEPLSHKYTVIPLVILVAMVIFALLLRKLIFGKVFLYAMSVPLGWLTSFFFVNGLGFESFVIEKSFSFLNVALDTSYCTGFILLCICFLDLLAQDFMNQD